MVCLGNYYPQDLTLMTMMMMMMILTLIRDDDDDLMMMMREGKRVEDSPRDERAIKSPSQPKPALYIMTRIAMMVMMRGLE